MFLLFFILIVFEILIILSTLINLISAFECQINSECNCTRFEGAVFKVECKNEKTMILRGEEIEEIKFINLKKPITNADLIIYPNLRKIHSCKNFIRKDTKDLFKGAYTEKEFFF